MSSQVDRTNLKPPIQIQPTKKLPVIPTAPSAAIKLLPAAKQTSHIERIGVSATVAAEMIGVSERTIWNLATAGTIHYIRVGTRCIFSVRSLDQLVNGPKGTEIRLKNNERLTEKK